MGYAERRYSYRFGEGGFGRGGGAGDGLFGFSLTPWVKRLLIANTAVWLLTAVGLLQPRWTFNAFGFTPGELLVEPWTPFTYMFVHGGFWHLFMNMLVLFFFGPPLEQVWGGRAFIKYYVASGLGAVLLSMLLIPVLPEIGSGPVVGASGAVYGIMLAFAMRWPEAPVYIWGILPIKAKWFVGILGAVTFVSTFFGSSGGVAHWAHLGGLATGFLYLRWGDRFERSVRVLWNKLPRRVREPLGGAGGGGSGAEISVEDGGAISSGGGSRSAGASRPTSTRSAPGDEEDDLDRVNEILDKIREQGIESLTGEEREFLDEVSRRYQETPQDDGRR